MPGFDLKTATCGDAEIEFYDVGAGPALVLLHGGNCSADDLFGVAQALSDAYRLILPEGWRQAFDPWRLWLLLDQLGIRRTALLGHSAGGTTIREMYRLQPDRVWAFISADSSGAVVPGSMQLARNLPNDRFSARAAAMYAAREAEMMQLQPRHRGDYATSTTIARRLAGYQRAERYKHEPKRSLEPLPGAPSAIPDDGRFIRCPTLIMHTGRGKMGPADITDDWQAANVQAVAYEYHVIKEAGHWFWLEDLDLMLDLLCPFLAAHLPAD